MDKKRLAKEWLVFLGATAFSLFVLLPTFTLFSISVSGQGFPKVYFEVLSALFGYEGSRGAVGPWLLVMGPYFIVQLTRSTIWAYKTLKF